MAVSSVLSTARIALSYGTGFSFILLTRMALLMMRPDIQDVKLRPKDTPVLKLRDRYDFIIIGGGTAGCVLANRLSEFSNWNILVLEAGADEPLLADIPLFMPTLQLSHIDWQYKTQPSGNYCLAMNNGSCNWPRGKVLGGCSVLNAMLYVRGNKKDYDLWEAEGNKGWSYDEVLPYFKKSEDMRISEYKNSTYHGTDGYLTIEGFKYRTPISKVFLDAGNEMGYETRDINGEKHSGFTYSQGTLRDGLRCSTAKAFLRPASTRKNLHVSMDSHVEHVIFNSKEKSATAVVFKKLNEQHTIYVDKEVILSAGAIQSPQILMLSGIGPKDHLDDMKIKTFLDKPGVGENLQDHVALGGTAYLIDSPDSKQPLGSGFVLPRYLTYNTIYNFAMKKEGPMYALPECEVMGFINTKYANQTDDWPDIQLFFASYADNTDGGLFGKRDNGLTDEYYAEMYEPILYKDAFSILPLLMRPLSRGRIRLKSNNPYDHPLIYPNYFENEHDLDVLIEGAKFGYNLSKSETLKKYNAHIYETKISGCKNFTFGSDEYWKCAARHYSMTIYHPVGTCKMGPKSDNLSVVSNKLIVHGVTNLRVVDASIMPRITTGNTLAPVVMIAEKASDMIKKKWKEK